MTGDPLPRPVADGGTRWGLFESFPDPLVAYARGDRPGEADGRAGASEGAPVVRRVNPAFEATFAVRDEGVAGTPLDELVLTGSVPAGHEAGDPTDPDGTTESATGAADATATTAGSLLDRAREAGTGVRFSRGTGDGTRHLRVRSIAPGADGPGYLLFTDVTGLERERRDLAGTVARLERVAGVARHDIRNPLEVARIRLEAARDTGEDVHFEKVAGALDRIDDITRDVLAVGSADPTDAVAGGDVAESAWETVDTADAELVVSPRLPTVRGDADHLRGLFENLFRNSVEHGGREVIVRVEPTADGFAVADDGPGIPPDVGERVFEAGYSTAADNTGLGLAIVDRIAGEHGWQVSIAPDRGSSTDADGGARFELTGVERVEGGNGSGGSDAPDD